MNENDRNAKTNQRKNNSHRSHGTIWNNQRPDNKSIKSNDDRNSSQIETKVGIRTKVVDDTKPTVQERNNNAYPTQHSFLTISKDVDTTTY